MRWRTVIPLIVTSALLTTTLGARRASGDARDPGEAAATSAPSVELASLDRAFFATYELAVRQSFAASPPALLVRERGGGEDFGPGSGELVLHHAGQRTTQPLDAPTLGELESVARVPVALFAILSPSDGAPLDPPQLAELQQLHGAIAAAQKSGARSELGPAQRDRQEQILAASLELARTTLTAKQISSADLGDYCRRMAPLLRASADDAATLYLEALNAAVTRVLAQIPSADRSSLVVVVGGMQQSSIDDATVQYFDRLLGEPPEAERRVLRADVDDEATALRLVGMRQMARRVGEAFFDDPTATSRDPFGAAAKKIVPALKLPALARPGG